MDINKKIKNIDSGSIEEYLDINILKENKKKQIKLAFKRFFKNKLAVTGGIIVIIILVIAIFHSFLSPYDPYSMNSKEALVSISRAHPMGTDNLGRDYMSRVFYGAKLSMQVGLISSLIATFFGFMIGAIAGYYGGWIDNLIMRIMDVVITFPSLLLAIVFVSILGPSIRNAMIAIGVIYTPLTARVIRSAVMANKENEYIDAARAIGKPNLKILFFEVVPNCMSPLIVQASVTFADAILIEAGLSFLGLSVQPPMASWGKMLQASMQYMGTNPNLAIFPGIAISLSVLGYNLLGDGLRDVIDPRLRRG